MFGRFSIAHFGFTCQAQLLLRVHRKEIRPLYYIDEVKKSRGYDGYDVITSLAYTQNLNTKASMWCTKRQMIDYINAHPNAVVKTKYFRNGSWHVGEDVRVVDNEYLRTDPNNTKRDNLGKL